MPDLKSTAQRLGILLLVCLMTIPLAGSCLSLVLLGACARAPTAAPTSSSDASWFRTTDGAEMMLVPAGEFLMGSTDVELKAIDNGKPAHAVYLDAFWVDRTQVTNTQYTQFLKFLAGHMSICDGHDCVETQVEDEDSHILRHDGRYVVEGGFEDHPVIEVTWYGAQAYCEWAGGRLPTEAEWEKAARGADGRTCPWGDGWDAGRANVGETGARYTRPVGSYPNGASPYGALDMAGNVWEWVADPYDWQYYAYAPSRNPPGPDADTGERILRGGAWDSPPNHARASYRNATHCFGPNFRAGFRCARSLAP